MKDDHTVLKMIDALEQLANDVLKLKRTSIPRRPIVMEFCGSPKAGKTSCISALAMFLRRNGFRVKVLVERASVCPVGNKYDPLFNIWTVCSAMAELAETISNSPKEYDVVILDRGLFDALCWFEWQAAHHYLDRDSLEKISGFLTQSRWRAATDLVLVFEAISGRSIEREYAALLTRKRGSIMREPILESYLESIHVATEKYGPLFRNIRTFDTSEMDQNKVSFEVTNLVLSLLQNAVSESVGHIHLSDFEGLEFSGVKSYAPDVMPLGDCMRFEPRDRVEEDETSVQPIPIVVITDSARQRVLVAKKNRKAATEKSPEHNKTLLYFGGHTRLEDTFISGRRDVISVCRSALTRELKEEIGVDFCPEHLDPVFLVWEKDNERSSKHMAVCFLWEADLESIQVKMDKNEFSTSGDSGPVFANVGDLTTAQLESWSKAILARVFKVYLSQQELPLA
jgi:predicted NUDIX family phosphoesterase/thymidylate kinase